MSVNVVYTASAIAVGGRDGNTGTTDGRFDVKLARPKELGGLEIALDITLPGVARSEAQALIEKAHQICAYSNATRNNVAIKLGLIEA